MKRSDIIELPEYFDRYINLVPDVQIYNALFDTGATMWLEELPRLSALGSKTYAAGKWTVNDILQHIIDGERVFCYRALSIARGDDADLPSFNEDVYAANTTANDRQLPALLDELTRLRASTSDLFGSFNSQMLLREGTAGGRRMSVLAIGFVIAGHGIHHLNILRERYYPMI